MQIRRTWPVRSDGRDNGILLVSSQWYPQFET
jgi:hypothetical protein